MKNFTIIAAVAVLTVIGVRFLSRKDADAAMRLAEDELVGLKNHFKSLDDVADIKI